MPRALHVCKAKGCTELVSTARCETHAREYEAQRGSSARRGYGHAYRKATSRATRNATHCSSCGEPFTENNPATGGHVRAIRNGGSTRDGIVAQCRRCNYGWRRTGL